MGPRAFSRWQAAGTHLLICVVIAAAVIGVMLGVWYPGPLFEAAGGNALVIILVAVDVILGPLLTLIVFKSGKRGMKFDLVAIGLVQVAALIYGVHIVFLARPAFMVFIKDRFELITAAELDPGELAAAKYPQFRAIPWTGPLLAVAEMPSDPAERNKVVLAAFAGMDMQNYPRLFVPYAEHIAEVLAKASTLEHLRRTEPAIARVVDDYVKSSGASAAEIRTLLLRTRFAWIAVLVDPKTGQPVKMLLGEKII